MDEEDDEADDTFLAGSWTSGISWCAEYAEVDEEEDEILLTFEEMEIFSTTSLLTVTSEGLDL